jgi:signal transduction histidine kinase
MTDGDSSPYELEHARADLRSKSGPARARAARAILALDGGLPAAVDIEVRETLAKEELPWVRGLLLEILETGTPAFGEGVVVPAPSWDQQFDDVPPDVARQSLNTSARRVLHEVSAVVGRLGVVAREELAERYGGSETARELAFLTAVCKGLRTLASATEVPTLTEFDLGDQLKGLAATVTQDLVCPVLAAGPAPFLVTSDWALLSLAVNNTLVNAAEATLLIGPVNDRPVRLTWGSSATGAHVTIIDRGPGPPSFLARPPKARISTKDGHPGYGLATASEAMRSLGGEVLVQRNDLGGTSVIVSWPEPQR